MTAYRKPFSHNLYGKYDGVAKKALISHLVR